GGTDINIRCVIGGRTAHQRWWREAAGYVEYLGPGVGLAENEISAVEFQKCIGASVPVAVDLQCRVVAVQDIVDLAGNTRERSGPDEMQSGYRAEIDLIADFKIGDFIAENDIRYGRHDENVDTRSAGNEIRARATVDHIIARAADQRIVP